MPSASSGCRVAGRRIGSRSMARAGEAGRVRTRDRSCHLSGLERARPRPKGGVPGSVQEMFQTE